MYPCTQCSAAYPRYHSNANDTRAVRPAYTVTRSPNRRPELAEDVLTESSGSSVPEIRITNERGEPIAQYVLSALTDRTILKHRISSKSPGYSPMTIPKSPLPHSPRSKYANGLIERDHEGYFIDNEDRVFADVREASDTR